MQNGNIFTLIPFNAPEGGEPPKENSTFGVITLEYLGCIILTIA